MINLEKFIEHELPKYYNDLIEAITDKNEYIYYHKYYGELTRKQAVYVNSKSIYIYSYLYRSGVRFINQGDFKTLMLIIYEDIINLKNGIE